MNNETRDSTETIAQAKTLNRRNVIKVAIATAPLIATLPSGAALARSSNVISASSAESALDAQRRTLCLDVRSGTWVSGGLDLGVSPRGAVTAINDRDYRVDDSVSAATVSESQMCTNGGSFHYWRDGNWRDVYVRRGIMVSATALSSFAGSIYYTEI